MTLTLKDSKMDTSFIFYFYSIPLLCCLMVLMFLSPHKYIRQHLKTCMVMAYIPVVNIMFTIIYTFVAYKIIMDTIRNRTGRT